MIYLYNESEFSGKCTIHSFQLPSRLRALFAIFPRRPYHAARPYTRRPWDTCRGPVPVANTERLDGPYVSTGVERNFRKHIISPLDTTRNIVRKTSAVQTCTRVFDALHFYAPLRTCSSSRAIKESKLLRRNVRANSGKFALLPSPPG